MNDWDPSLAHMTFEQFIEWADEDTHVEWVDGEVHYLTGFDRVHQQILGFLTTLVSLFAQSRHLGRTQLFGYGMKLSYSFRTPDILFVSQANLERMTEDYLDGPADLAVEIISDGTALRDRRDKFQEYREAGVREYWIIDPRPGKQRADFYRLDETGDYDLFATEDDERVESAVLPGFWLRPAWLWQIDEITPLEAFYEIRGLSAEQIQQIQQLLRGDETT
jgi:Uma2 family endonuclease